ncbi:MAG: polysaccharide biosynthesis protein [Desulfovibrionaceae bacterium]
MRGVLRNVRNLNFWLMLAADLCIFAGAFAAAYLFRFDLDIPPQYREQLLATLPFVPPLKAVLFFAFGQYRGMWRYTSLADSFRLLRVTLLQSLALVVLVAYVFHFEGFPRSVFVLDWLLTLFLSSGLRVSIRAFYARRALQTEFAPPQGEPKTVLIVGAGRAGELVCRELLGNGRLHYSLAGFVDDDPKKRGRTIHNKAVLGAVADLPALVRRHGVDEILIAVSEASPEQMRAIVAGCKRSGAAHKILPPMSEIMDGNVTLTTLRDVNYLDLLGRTPVSLDVDGIGSLLSGRTVLVTGCGGSIGSELVRQIVRFDPGLLVLVDASEFNLYQIQMELTGELGFAAIRPVLGSVCDAGLMDRVFAEHKPEVVFHAAAYKHVPMLEKNPWQAVINNILGTRTLMRAASRHNTGRFVLVSTDKAVRPTNVMGASKRVTEQLMHAFAESETVFMAVRFGNVVGSSGSVVPLFRRQIERGGPVTVTHPEITRYFMSISEAAQLILQAGTMGRGGGEIFLLDMGVPVRIADMARDLIRLSGKEPDKDVEIVFTGLREGEKLYEELMTQGEDVVRTEHNKIMVLRSREADRTPAGARALEEAVEGLAGAAQAQDAAAVRAGLRAMVPDYAPDQAPDSAPDSPAPGSASGSPAPAVPTKP